MAKSFEGVTRRGVVAAGAALSAGAATQFTATEAQAAPASALDRQPISEASPVATTIASARQNYIVYRTVGEFDISVESSSAERQFGGRGVHSIGAQTSLWASVDIPGGVTIRDVEFYATNTSASTVYAGVWLWTADSGYFSYQLAQAAITSQSSQQAVQVLIPEAQYGPYPTGTKLFLTIFTPTDGKVQWNGARVGMRGGGQVSLNVAPVRVYDSRETSKFSAGLTRTVALSLAECPPGTVGIMATVTVLQASSAGLIKLYPASEPRPAEGQLYHPASAPTTFNVTIPVPTSRKFSIYSQREAHVLVDIVGTIG